MFQAKGERRGRRKGTRATSSSTEQTDRFETHSPPGTIDVQQSRPALSLPPPVMGSAVQLKSLHSRHRFRFQKNRKKSKRRRTEREEARSIPARARSFLDVVASGPDIGAFPFWEIGKSLSNASSLYVEIKRRLAPPSLLSPSLKASFIFPLSTRENNTPPLSSMLTHDSFCLSFISQK